ncbi:MAG TPA: hypothetical protein VFE17_06075 [Candidatus Baltobacteraceae bacterium]|nr:hypothetical protein [Candidatus Baltobacteraceae bacterium]
MAQAAADDFGPGGDVRQVRSNAIRLLAQRVRASGTDPQQLQISDVVVVRDQAILSWRAGSEHGVMGLARYLDRWWDALDAQPRATCWYTLTAFPLDDAGLSNATLAAAAVHNADARTGLRPRCPGAPDAQSGALGSLSARGGTIHPTRGSTAGYDFTVRYAQNNAPAAGVPVKRLYGRAPTTAEALPNPPPPQGWGGPTNVFFFNIAADSPAPITVTAGTVVTIWFPFVLNDSLGYRLSYVSGGQFSPSIHGTIFDNVLTFTLPAFTLAPGGEFQAEVEGFW